MLATLTRHWWAVALRGVAAVLFGLMALIWPGITLMVLVALFGAYVLVDGVMAVATAIGRGPGVPRAWLMVEGIADIVIGVLTFAWPGITTIVLLWLIAAWAVSTGVIEIVNAARLRRELHGEWLLALGGVLSVLFGIALVVWPVLGALGLVMLIGAYAVVFGVALIALATRLRRANRGAGAVGGIHRAATA
jgi:uncharacterized membrane protein HdeD (DUF308 family)